MNGRPFSHLSLMNLELSQREVELAMILPPYVQCVQATETVSEPNPLSAYGICRRAVSRLRKTVKVFIAHRAPSREE